MRLFAHRKLSEKIGWSFAGLIMLVALNAGVALLTVYLAYRQIDRQQETATILTDINRVNSALSRYGKDSSRDSAMDIFHNLDRVRQQTRHPVGASAEISSLFPLIDDFRLQSRSLWQRLTKRPHWKARWTFCSSASTRN